MHPPYKHTQTATAILVWVLVIPAIMIGILFFATSIPRLTLATIMLVMIVSTVLFSSLTIHVDETRLRWVFGIGLIRKSVALADVASVAPIKTTFMQGWGIHLTRNGWLYNVSGYDAVHVQLKSGKSFLLGTDEPAALCAAVRAHQTQPSFPNMA